jgi:hypothetical protein
MNGASIEAGRMETGDRGVAAACDMLAGRGCRRHGSRQGPNALRVRYRRGRRTQAAIIGALAACLRKAPDGTWEYA